MASSESRQQPPNPAPPSPSAGGHESRDYYASQNEPRPFLQNEPYLTPYLGLRARLSQTWINRWTILLLLVLFRTLIAIARLDDDIGSARTEALSMCTSVENVGSAMASMPYYMSQGVNDLTADGIDKAIDGLKEMLLLTLTGVEEIVVFVINMMTSTYLCLITLAVSGSLHVAISVAEDVGNFLNSTVQGVGKDLGSAENTFQNAMNGFVSEFDKIASSILGKDLQPPTIDLSQSIQTLSNLQLPAGYDQGLEKLNSSIPTFDQVKNFTESVIRFPFQEVKKLVNESLPNYHMDRSLFPVPAKQQLSFCTDGNMIGNFFDDLVEIERDARKAFLAVLVILAVGAMAPMGYREIRSWRFMKRRAELIRSGVHDPMDAVYLVSRPYTSSTGLWLSRRFNVPRRQALVRWTIAYATTLPALFVLSLAVASLLACLCQFVLLKLLAKEIPILENQVIGFADKVIDSLNNASMQWSIGINHVINDTNADINHDVFGWVNTTTIAVNNTLNTFVDDMVKVLNVTFGGTVLYTPILDVLNCLVILKIRGIEKGLTWVSDHAHVDFPMLPNDTFSLGTIQKVSGSADNILATGPNGGAADAITAAVEKVITALQKVVRQEAIIASCLLLIWVFVAIVGFIRALYMLYSGHGKTAYTDPTKSVGGNGMPQEKLELDNFVHPAAPSYEQATGIRPSGDHAADRYNGVSYTLRPNPPPRFEASSSQTNLLSSASGLARAKLGRVRELSINTAAISRPSQVRTSSHGCYGVTSPVSPLGAKDILRSPVAAIRKLNPFATSRD